jgi:hypothetical protein
VYPLLANFKKLQESDAHCDAFLHHWLSCVDVNSVFGYYLKNGPRLFSCPSQFIAFVLAFLYPMD